MFAKPLLPLLLTILAASAQTPTHSESDTNASPLIAALRKDVAASHHAALDQFWQQVRKTGAPLVESISGDHDNSLVTFLWQGDSKTRNVVIFDGVAGFDAKDRMTQLDGTNVWYKTYKVRNDARFAYNLSPNDTLDSFDNIKDDDAMKRRLAMFRTDPLNRRRCPATFGSLSAEASYVELPAAPPQPWNASRPDSAKGTVRVASFRSGILKNVRKLWIYTPAGFSRSAADYPLLVLFDGDRNVKWVPAILDNLIAQKRIPPTVAVLIDNPSTAARKLELPCYPPFGDFLATELVPWVRENYRATSDPARTIAAGSSYGGLAAVFAGLRHPEVFGNVLSISGIAFGGNRITALTQNG